MDTRVYQRANPSTQATFLTTSSAESAALAAAGFTAEQSSPFRVSTRSATGLTAVHRLYRPATGDYLFTTSTSEVASAGARYGYLDQGVRFYAPRTGAACLVPVHRYLDRRNKHQLVSTETARRQLAAQGARYEGIAFYAAPPAAPPPDAPAFTLAVVPPTQTEVLRAGDTRWANRTAWLARNKTALNLRFVADTGDVVNWGNVDRRQLAMVQSALGTLESAGIPYSLALGNHDTAAVCVGGSACDRTRTRELFRDTSAFNSYFTAADFGAVSGQFEPGKVDNSYSTFEAGGRRWMVLTLEMWPRGSAVAWARQVVAAHPGHNVAVVTHQYLTGSSQIATNADYGQTSPRILFQDLVSRYRNIKLVFSGHEGRAAYRTDRGVHGNTIYSIGVHLHDPTNNPIQLVRIDAKAGTLTSRVYAPNTDMTLPGFSRSITGIAWT